MPDVPVEDQTAVINRKLLSGQFTFKSKVQGVTFSAENPHVLVRQWRHLQGSIQVPVTTSMVVLMGPLMKDMSATSYWMEMNLSQIWAFKSEIGRRGELTVKVAMMPLTTCAPNADDQIVLGLLSDQGRWRRQITTAGSISGYFPVEAISVNFGAWAGYVAVTLQNGGGDRKSLMHCDKLHDWLSCPDAMWGPCGV